MAGMSERENNSKREAKRDPGMLHFDHLRAQVSQ